MPELQKKPSGFQRFTNRLFDPGPNVTEQSIQQNNALADALFAQGSDPRPIQSSAQGFAQLAQALNSQILRKRGEKGAEALKAQESKQIGNVLNNLALHPQGRQLIESLGPEMQQAAIAKIVGQRFEQPEQKNTSKQFREADEFVTRRVVNGQPDMTDAGVLSRSPIDRVSRVEQGGPGDFDLNTKKINTDAVESANASAALRRNLTATLPEVEANKESVGFRGQAGLALGGVATNVLGEAAGNEVANAIAGNDQQKIAQVLTRMQTLRSALIPILTGEKSSRFSEPEREIANRAVGIIDEIKGPADLTRSFPQVQGAMKELTVATLENEFEQAANTPAVDFPFDLNSDQGFIELGQMLSDAGFSLEEAIRARDRLIRIQNQ